MTKKVLPFPLFLGSAILLLGMVYFPMAEIPFAMFDDYCFWGYDCSNSPFGHPQHVFFMAIGRGMSALINVPLGYFVHKFDNVVYVRFFGVIITAIWVAVSALMVYRLAKFDKTLAFFIGASFSLLPTVQIILLYFTSSANGALAILFSITAALLLDCISPQKIRFIFSSFYDLTCICLAVVLLIASLMIYQTYAMFIIIFSVMRLLFSEDEERLITRWKIIRDTAVLAVACGVYWIIQQCIMKLIFSGKVPDYGFYNFKLVSFNEIINKISLFFTNLTPLALNVWTSASTLKYKGIVVFITIIVIFIGLSIVLVKGYFKYNRSGRLRWFFKYIFEKVSIFVFLLVFANIPNIAPKGYRGSPVTCYIYSLIILLLIIWSIYHACSLIKSDKIRNIILKTIIGGMVILPAFVAQKNTLCFARLNSVEIKFMESVIIPKIKDRLQIHIIRPIGREGGSKKSCYTFAELSSHDKYYAPWMVSSILINHGININNIKITTSALSYPFKMVSADAIIVDMSILYNILFNNRESTVAVDLVKTMEEFNIIYVKNPTEGNRYFAVLSNEYSIDRMECVNPRGCSIIFEGDSIDRVIEQINKYSNGAFIEDICTIDASSVMDSYGPEPLLSKGQFTPWHAQFSPKYPEWIRFDFHIPITINKVSIRSQEIGSEKSGWDRGPKEFILQISDDGETWKDVMHVENACTDKGGAWREFLLPNPVRSRFARILILSNCGHPTLLTVGGVRFE